MATLQWQLAHDSARSYEDVLVPTFLGPAAETAVAQVPALTGTTVLDAGCGTGAAARAALVRGAARVVGADVNRFMLAVGRESLTAAEFWDADVRALPFPDGSFDVVACTHTLQFVPEPERAVREFARVLRPGGRLVLTTWVALPRLPYFAALADAVSRVLGRQIATALTSASALPSGDALRRMLAAEGFGRITAGTQTLQVALGDLETFVPRHLASTPMAGAVRAAGSALLGSVTESVVEALDPERTGDVISPFTQNLLLAAR